MHGRLPLALAPYHGGPLAKRQTLQRPTLYDKECTSNAMRVLDLQIFATVMHVALRLSKRHWQHLQHGGHELEKAYRSAAGCIVVLKAVLRP